MSNPSGQSPIQKARKRINEAKRREAEMLAKLTQWTAPGKLSEEEAKRFAAALMEMMKE